MLVRIRSGTVLGVTAVPVDVEVEAGEGMPGFHMVGLASSAVQEAKVRVLAALRNGGHRLPARKVTVNLAPGDLRKEGTGFDLPIAVALFCAGAGDRTADLGIHMVGELALSGEVRPVRGVLPLAIEARRVRARALVVPAPNGLEAAVVEGLQVVAVEHLSQVVAWLEGRLRPRPPLRALRASEAAAATLDLGEVVGQEHARRALEIAAAGGHNLLFFGPPGSGMTMLARRRASSPSSPSRRRSRPRWCTAWRA